MEEIVFKTSRIRLLLRTYPIIIVGAMLGGILVHGLRPFSNIYNYLIEGIIVGFFMILFPVHRLTVVLNQRTLTAPLVKSMLFKPVTVDITDIIISRRFIDRLCASEVTTVDGRALRISLLFHGNEAKRRILQEIMNRKDKLESLGQSSRDRAVKG